MTVTPDLRKMMNELDIPGLKQLHTEAETMLRQKAMTALQEHQEQENALRELAGLKKRPVKGLAKPKGKAKGA